MRTIRGILFHENDDKRLDMGETECLSDEERHCEKWYSWDIKGCYKKIAKESLNWNTQCIIVLIVLKWTKMYFLAKYHVFQDNLAEF